MRGALIHGVLLAVMLVYGYRTWTRDKSVKVDIGSVVLWDKSEKDIASIAYKSDTREVKLEQRTANGETYWWGSDTTITKQPKPEPPKAPEPAAGSGAGSGSAKPPGPAQGSGAAAGSGSGSAGSGSAGSGAGSGSAAKPPEPPKPPEMIDVKKVREFPLGEGGEKIVKNYTAARAIRDLGTPSEAQKKTYKFDTSKATITIAFKDGSSRSFKLGDAVYGNQDKYALDDKGRAYVLSKDLLTNLELGEQSLYLSDPRGFDAKKIEAITIEGAGKVKSGFRTTTEVEGKQVKTWADGETKKPHPSLGNFIDQLGAMPPSEYAANVKPQSLTAIVKVTYKDGDGKKLGTLTLLKGEKQAAITPDMEVDPANPPRGDVEYYVVTEKSRVPAVVRKDTAQQVEQNLPVIMNSQPPEPGAVTPKGNPFGNGPLPTPGAPGGADPHGHGAPPPGGDPHGGMAPPPGGAPGGAMTPPPGGAPPGGAPAGGAPAGGAPAGGAKAGSAAPAGGAPAGGAKAGSAAPAGGAPTGGAKAGSAAPASGAKTGSAAAPATPKAAPAAGSAAPAAPKAAPAAGSAAPH